MPTIDKDRFHRAGQRRLRELARALGLTAAQYNIRSNKGGPAVLGEVTLHADMVYVQLGGTFWEERVMVRTCKGQKDYTGGANHYLDPRAFMKDEISTVAERVRHVMQKGGTHVA